MRKWFKYHVRAKTEQALQSLFILQNEINDHISYDVNYNISKDEFFFNISNSPLITSMVSTLEKEVKSGDKAITIGCSNAEHEIALFNKHPALKTEWDLTDYDEKSINFLKLNFVSLSSFRLDILHSNFEEEYKNLLGQYDVVFAPGILYLFDNAKALTLFKNLRLLLKNKNSKIIFCFRSRDHFFIKIIDIILVPLNAWISYLFKKFIKREDISIAKSLHGYRRTDGDVNYLIKNNNLVTKTIYRSCFDLELSSRLSFFERLGVNRLLRLIIGKSIPYLNIYILCKGDTSDI